MRRTLLLLALPVFLFTACNQNKDDIASKIARESKKHNSVSFKLTQKFYYSDRPDTTITPFEVWIVRDNSDTLRNGYIWVDNFYRPYNMIYDAGTFYLAIPPKKTTVPYSNYTEAFISPVDWIDIFLNPDLLTDQTSDPSVQTRISDTTWQGKACTKLSLNFPAGKNGANKKYIYVIDNNDLVPLWAMMESKSKSQTYTDELFFNDYEFDKADIDKLKERQKKVLSENKLEKEGADSEVSRLEKMLHEGDKTPVFSGKYYQTGEEFKLADYVGKNVIILDFWYTHCPPCVKAMPALSELYDQYKDRGLKIFGLNSVDNQPHSMDYLNKFLGKRQISYDIILTKPAVDLMYKIKGYPTMYIVNKEGNIAWVEIGFNEEKFSKLKEKIDELTK
jgi:thiol-disulfide isomerase/thioredoxin